jgi:hypothetical protein
MNAIATGSSLWNKINGVTAPMAAARHPHLAHSIWALVQHLSAWVEVVTLRIVEWRAIEMLVAGDFPPVTDPGDAAWTAALADLDRRHGELLRVVAGLEASRLEEIVLGKDYPVAVRLHGIVPHDAYHAGQVALLKKVVGR